MIIEVNDPDTVHHTEIDYWPVAALLVGYVTIFVGGPFYLLRAMADSFWKAPHTNKSTVKVTLSEKHMSWTVNNHTTAIDWNDIAFVEISNTGIAFVFKVTWIETISLPDMSNNELIKYCKQLRAWGVSVKLILPEETEER